MVKRRGEGHRDVWDISQCIADLQGRFLLVCPNTLRVRIAIGATAGFGAGMNAAVDIGNRDVFGLHAADGRGNVVADRVHLLVVQRHTADRLHGNRGGFQRRQTDSAGLWLRVDDYRRPLDAFHGTDHQGKVLLLRDFVFFGMYAGRVENAAVGGVLLGLAEIRRQGLGVGQCSQVKGPLGVGYFHPAAFDRETVQSSLAEGRLHLLQRGRGDRVAAEEVLVATAHLRLEQIANTDHGDDEQQSGRNPAAGSHRAEQVAELGKGFIEEVHGRLSVVEFQISDLQTFGFQI